MAFTEKKYVDLDGLKTFSTSLKNKLAANTADAWVVNYAKTAGSATKATQDGSGNVIVDTYLTQADAIATYVPFTKEIAGLKLSTDITADALRKAINVEDGSEKNKIVAITIDGVAQNPDGERKVALDLSAYAKRTDITAVLKFMGIKTSSTELPTANADSVGHVWIVTSGSKDDAYAEYVCVDNGESADKRYTWEKLGNGASLDGYYTQEQIDAKFTALSLANPGAEGKFISSVSQTEGVVSASATAFATSVAEDGKVAPTSGAVYTAIEGAKSALIGTGAGDLGSTIKKNEAAIATLNGADSVKGSVAKSIKDAIGGLTGTQSEGYYVTSVTQADGKVTVTRENKGSVADGNTGLVDGGTVHSFVTTHVTNAIQGLDATDVGSDGSFISLVGETDGVVHATATPFATIVKDITTDADKIAPTEHAVRTAVDEVYTAFGRVADEDIQKLFA